MATKTLYVLNTAATSPGWFGSLQDGGTAPTAANTSFGLQTGKLAIASFGKLTLGATAVSTTTGASSYIGSASGPTAGTGSGAATAGDSFRAGPYSGNFASGNWSFSWVRRPTTTSMQGRINMRVWRSANSNGSSATEITSGKVNGSNPGSMASTTTDYNSSITWAAPAISLNNEYLFFQLEWEELVAAGSANGSTWVFRVGTAQIVTTNFTVAYTITADEPISPIPLVGNPVSFIHGYGFSLANKSYTLTGKAVGLVKDRPVTAAQGTYALTGKAVTLTYAPSTAIQTTFDFTSSLPSSVTFSRTSTASYYGSDGLLKVNGAASGAARIDYDPFTKKSRGLLMEQQRTNTLRASNDPTNTTYWTASALASMTQNAIGPDGTANSAWTITEDTANTQHRIYQAPSDNSAGAVGSVYLKYVDCRYMTLAGWQGGAVPGAQFDLLSGKVTKVGGYDSTTYVGMDYCGNGWWRCWIRFRSDIGRHWMLYFDENNSGVAEPSYTGTSKSALFYGAQQEDGYYMSSYIPTTTAAVTRSVDAASITGTNFSSWFDATKGTFVLAGTPQTQVDYQFADDIARDAANTNCFITSSGGAVMDWIVRSGGSNGGLVPGWNPVGNPAPNYQIKTRRYERLITALAYASGDYAACLDGGPVATNASLNAIALPTGIDRTVFGGGNNGHWIERLDFYNVRKTNAQLQTLTENPKVLDFSEIMPSNVVLTRASIGTYVGKDGLLKTAGANEPRIEYDSLAPAKRTNYCLYSNDFSNAAWSKENLASYVQNAAGPDGASNTAWTVTENTSGGAHRIYQGSMPGAVGQVLSVYAKNVDARYVYLAFYYGTAVLRADFDLLNGTVVGVSDVGTSDLARINYVGNGWYRIQLTSNRFGAIAAIFGLNSAAGAVASVDPTYTGTSKSVIFYGAQDELGVLATSYIPTTSAVVTVTDPFVSKSRGLLTEPSRTNILLRSNEFSNAAWGANSGVTITDNFTTSPDGTINASKVVLNAPSGSTFIGLGQLYSGTVNIGDKYTVSAWVRADVPTDICIGVNGGSHPQTNNGSLQLIDTNWRRLSYTGIIDATDASGLYFVLATSMSANGGASFISTSGARTIYVYGAQLELGSFATSYIPTTTAAATRAADSTIMTGTNSEGLGDSFKDWYNNNEGTIVTTFDRVGESVANEWYWRINNSNSTQYQGFYENGSDYLAFADYVGISSTGTILFPVNEPYKSAFSYNTNFRDGYASGNGPGVNTGAYTPPDADRIGIGSPASGSEYRACHIKRIEYYPKQKTDAEVKALSLSDHSWNFTKSLPDILTRSRASTATMFDSSGYLVTVPSGYMRLTTDPVTLQPDGLLVEPQATNLILQSNAFTTTWNNNPSAGLSSASGTSPDGTNNAWKHYSLSASGSVNTGGAAGVGIDQGATTSASRHVVSIFLKAAGKSWYAFGFYDHDGDVSFHRAWFNLSTGVVGTKESGVNSAYMVDCGNGWYQCFVTYTKSSGTVLKISGGPVDADALPDSVASGTNGILIYGAQMELSWQGPTSYVPTTTAQVTRSADFVYFGGDNFTSFWSPAAGTLVPNAKMLEDNPIVGLATTVGWFGIIPPYVDIQDNVNRNVLTMGASIFNSTIKIAVGYDASGSSGSENGAAAVVGSSTLPNIASIGASVLWLGYYPQSTARGHIVIRSLDYYPTRKTNTEVVALSSIAGNIYTLACDKGTIAFSGKILGLARTRILALAQGSRALTGQVVAFVRARSLVLAQGTNAVSGQAATFVRARTLVLAQGTRPVTGQAAIFAAGRHLISSQGAVAFAGQATAFVFARKVAASLGTETLTGQAVGLKGPSRLVMGQGAFALSGQQTQLIKGRPVALAQGTQTVVGQSAAFVRARTLPLAQGTRTLAGQSAIFVRARTLVLAQGARTVAGQATALVAGRKLTLAQGAQPVSGQVAGLAIGRKIATAQGTQVFAGQAVGLIAPKRVQADLGSLVVAGRTAALVHGYQLGLIQGSLLLTGRALAMVRARQLLLGAGAPILTGQGLILTRGRQLLLSSGTRTVAGQATVLYRGWQLLLSQGTRTLTGQSAIFVRGRTAILSQGSPVFSGKATGLAIGRKLISDKGTIAFSGNNVTIFKGGAQRIDTTKGTIAFAGQATILAAGHKAILSQGINTLAGQLVSFVRARQVLLSNNSMSLSGQSAALVRGRQLALARGNLTALGQAGIFFKGKGVQLSGVTALFAGQTLGLVATRKLILAQGTTSFVGTSVGLRRGSALLLDYGSRVLTGKPTGLVVARKLLLNNATINIVGKSLTRAYVVVPSYGSLTFAGIDSAFKLVKLLNISLGALTFNGRSIGIIYVPIGTYRLNLGTLPFTGLDAFLKYRKAWTGPVSKSTMFVRGKRNVLMIRRQ